MRRVPPRRIPLVKPLSGCLALALAAGAGADANTLDVLLAPHGWPQRRPAGILIVDNCNDSGPGSLRAAMDAAIDGSGIFLKPTGCSTITLTTGELATSANDLTVMGPGRSSLSISGNHASRVFAHDGGGYLDLFDFTLRDGLVVAGDGDDARGGCLYSNGSLYLLSVGIVGCEAQATGNGEARGGGIYVRGDVKMSYSLITDNVAQGASSRALGGGLYSAGVVQVGYDGFLRNMAIVTGTGAYGYGGGIWSSAGANVFTSTLQGNSADRGGGIAADGLHMKECTLYANVSRRFGGAGIYIGGSTSISGSTITGNVESNPDGIGYGAGVSAAADVHIDLQSSIVSGNVLSVAGPPGYIQSDIGSGAPSTTVISGANNLVGHSSLPVPDDTIITDDPQLGSLRGNGGPTQTMMPLATSPVINAGNRNNGARYDQRGPGHPRIVGAAVDIGAVESNVLLADHVFADGFD